MGGPTSLLDLRTFNLLVEIVERGLASNQESGGRQLGPVSTALRGTEMVLE